MTESMFDRILTSSNVFYRSEQVDSADLTDIEKRALLQALYYTKPAIFLQRYHRVLCVEDAACFSQSSDDYTIDFYLNRLKNEVGTSNELKKHKLIRNRRYAYMQKLIVDGKYFDDEHMRQRDPLLFDHMISRFLSDEEKRRTLMPKSHLSGTLTGLFVDFDDTQRTALLRRDQQRIENDHNRWMRHAQHRQIHPAEQSSSDDDVDDGIGTKSDDDDLTNDEDKQKLRDEYLAHMKERFLAGCDAEWIDYADIDNDERWDLSISETNRDAEDAYFDGDDDQLDSSPNDQ